MNSSAGYSPPRHSSRIRTFSIRPTEAARLALEQKLGMLSRSFRSEQDNFASNSAEAFEDTTGYVAKVGFRGKDGRTLIALIDEDCYLGWTKSDR